MGIILPSNEVNFIIILLIEFFINLVYISFLYYIGIKSNWNGIRLSVLFFLCFYGISNLLNHIEVIIFHDALNMSLNESILFLISGLITYLLFCPLFVLMIGKWKQKQIFEKFDSIKNIITIKNFLKILLLSAIIYPVIYFSFGFFFAWRFEALRSFYSSSEMPGIFTIYILQIFRALIWILISIPIIFSLKISSFKKSIILGLIFGIFMTFGLFYPNPYMPLIIRMIHFFEVMVSNFIWGFLIIVFIDKNKIPANKE
jgi:hypothetical protein